MKRNQYPSEISGRPQQPDEITMDESAALLGLTKSAIARAVSLGYIPSRLIARSDGGGGRGMRVVKRADVWTYGAQRSRGPR